VLSVFTSHYINIYTCATVSFYTGIKYSRATFNVLVRYHVRSVLGLGPLR